MSFALTTECRLDRLARRIRSAREVTPELVEQLIDVCPRIRLVNRSGEVAGRVAALVEQHAWLDLGLALIRIEMPAWTLRHLIYDNGTWHCSLSQQPNMPLDFDDSVDAEHEALPLAVFAAILQARQRAEPLLMRAAPSAGPIAGNAICCDNFA